MKLKKLPGTTLDYPKEGVDAFSVIEPVLTATGGLTLRQVCDMTGLPPSTIQNWVKRGWVAGITNKRYSERHLMRILLINMMKDAMQLDRIVALMAYINGSVEDEGDDIIPDRLLYSMLCQILYECVKNNGFQEASVREIIRHISDQHECVSRAAQEKLVKTLTVMTWASISAYYRQKSEQEFHTL